MDVINYVGLAYGFSAVLLFLLSYSFHSKRLSRIIDSLLPNTVIGPAISLIGLELVKIGGQDAKLLGGSINEKIIVVFTIFAIIFASLIRKKVLNNASIFTGVILGCVLYYIIVDKNFMNIIKTETGLFEFIIVSLAKAINTINHHYINGSILIKSNLDFLTGPEDSCLTEYKYFYNHLQKQGKQFKAELEQLKSINAKFAEYLSILKKGA